MVKINGEEHSWPLAVTTVGEYLDAHGYRRNRVVVEHNFNILDADALNSTKINDGDNLEILNFVGGG